MNEGVMLVAVLVEPRAYHRWLTLACPILESEYLVIFRYLACLN